MVAALSGFVHSGFKFHNVDQRVVGLGYVRVDVRKCLPVSPVSEAWDDLNYT